MSGLCAVVRRSVCVAAAVCSLWITPAALWADPQGLRVQDTTSPAAAAAGLRTGRIYVVFDDPGDTLLSIGFADIVTMDPLGFLQDAAGGDAAPDTTLCGLPGFELLCSDSFVTVNATDAAGNATGVDGDWNSCHFNCLPNLPPCPPSVPPECGHVVGGWFNGIPPNGQGTPNADLEVLILQFTIRQGFDISGSVLVFFNDGRQPAALSFDGFDESCRDDGDCPPGQTCVKGTCQAPDSCGDPAAGDCFDLAGNGTPGCADPDCCNAVCAQPASAYCCEQQWDAACAAQAVVLCAGSASFSGAGCYDSDLDDDGDTGETDRDLLLDDWGPCAGCASDLNCDGTVNAYDLALLLGNWGQPGPSDCGDGNACTADSCDAATCTCLNQPIECDDGDACTVDDCDAASGCTHDPLDCGDGDACTVDGCDALKGCVYSTVNCDDANACTADACDPADGCVHDIVNCDDGNACTDECTDPSMFFTFPLEGAQQVPPVATPGSGSCTVALQPSTGFVTAHCDYQDLAGDASAAHIHGLAPPGVNAPVIVPLAVSGGRSGTAGGSGTLSAQQVQGMIDGLTYVNVHSQFSPPGEIRGQVVGGFEVCCDPAEGCTSTPVDCDDGNACTTDSCEPSSGCLSSTVNCDDGNACTEDTCDAAVGCVNETVSCDDGDACTIDTCNVASGCDHATLDCNDGDPCTEDACDPAVGCVYQTVDTDADGTCDAQDPDDDNDGVLDIDDPEPLNPDVCGDSDMDSCDNCTVGTDDFGPLPDNNPANDGPDADGDGVCDTGDNCPEHANPDQADCDGDSLGDVCAVAKGVSTDCDGNGTPDNCETCPEDINNDGQVNELDLALLLGAWGSNPGSCADLNGDGTVNAPDLAQLLGAWGPCP